MATAVNASFTSPSANALHGFVTRSTGDGGFFSHILAATNGWTLVLTLLIMLVAYDQFKYIWNKGTIAGPALKIPFMGPFLDSVNPKFEGYMDKWNSGALSCVSVFHKSVLPVQTTSPVY
ncbi:MAG: RNA polymerase C-22 sterol desaturase [Caeruleum heppii]|nr:MAG: RNA polymerase C-22 sterol desaturase [Caeruleum heppii]